MMFRKGLFDFEVMPLGTIAEVQAIRKFSIELIELVDRGAEATDLASKINEIRSFYAWHCSVYQ